MNRAHLPGYILAFAASLLAAGFLIPWKLATEARNTDLVVLVMLTSAALFNSVFYLVKWPKKRQFFPSRLELLLCCGFAVLTLLGNHYSARAAAVLSPPLLSTFLRTEVIVISLMAWFILGEKVEGLFWWGVALVVGGFSIMQNFAGSVFFSWNGAAYAGIATLAFSLLSVLTRKYIKKMDPLLVNALRLWMAVALWFAVNGYLPGPDQFHPSLVYYASLAALFGPVLARLCIMYSAMYIEARLTALMLTASPVITLVFSYVILKDLPTIPQCMGGVLMIIGVMMPLLQKSDGNRERLAATRSSRSGANP